MNLFHNPKTYHLAVFAVMLIIGVVGCSSENDNPSVPCTQDDTNPTITSWANPVYPIDAVRQEIEGTVIVKVLVGAGGKVVHAEIIQSVHQSLDDSAIAAATNCKFIQGTRDCELAELWMALPFNFRLNSVGTENLAH